MAIRKLSVRSSLHALRPEITYSLGHFKADPLASAQVPVFTTLLTDLDDVCQKEQTFCDKVIECRVLVHISDRVLNRVASRVHKEVLIITDDSMTHDLYKHYFGQKTLKDFIRPTLSTQLTAMAAWVESLSTSEHPSLKALAPEVEAAVKAAKDADQARIDTRLALKNFRETGDRKQYVNKLNAARKFAHGSLSKIGHENDALPANYADGFFLHEITESEEDVTEESVLVRIAELTEELNAQHEMLKQLKAEEAARAKAEAEENEQRAALAKLEKIREDAEKQAAVLRATLKKKKKATQLTT